ncbi:sigma 54-interacting transcriptional regulator [Reichenbachiella ulvae]|uniref:Sigma 54-interacting transcriptional regulator n=1 Tax=Reichenbachiella ulvae TaxID=2980104 RepID=A0ABT3CTZ6_9BACT|nr:sigma 54-interacting transcriptional regulator [Reichenbachiella ulvae]MCV9387067.1 sigma 54-interacting transcriptional regulator [Reichenbachiella ulvae]
MVKSYKKLDSASKLAINTLGELKASGYEALSVKDELRQNLIQSLQEEVNVFEGILGYEDTVIPDVERAILSKHNINFLGLRGQAKTRMARMMVRLLDEYVPVVAGSELNDDPLNPLSRYAKDLIKEKGDDTPVEWLHRDERFTEKLATPDVSIADLIGDVDPIKAASLKLPYSDERVIHYGLVPRSHRGIFVINEIPDLQPRIQVALFNILQEGDIQIRGFKLRLPLDIQFVFTANPEDYTNRGSIVTPLKDRLGSQIITHYPKSIHTGIKITEQEAKSANLPNVHVNEIAKLLIEQVAVEARSSEYVDVNSGVSARLTISSYENLVSSIERRLLINKEKEGTVRITDFIGVIPSITGKVELVYEGEQEGPGIVAHNLIGKAIRTLFTDYFEDPDEARKNKEKKDPYKDIANWFGNENVIDILHDYPTKQYRKELDKVPGLADLVKSQIKGLKDESLRYFLMEFVLFALVEYSYLSKHTLENGMRIDDLIGSMFSGFEENEGDF